MTSSYPSVLVTGARGLLGRYLVDALVEAGQPVVPTYNGPASEPTGERRPAFQHFEFLDASGDELARQLEKFQVGTVVHLAALSNVDECEKNQDRCKTFNVETTKRLAHACKRTGTRFFFASTNAVYDGKTPPFSERSSLNPVHVYGRSKRDAENLVADSGADFVILRFILAFGWNASDARENPMTQILSAYLSGKRKLRMVDDVFANTLYAGQAAQAVVKCIQGGTKHEVFNVAGKSRESRYQFAQAVKEAFHLQDLEIEAVSSAAFTELVPRPKDTSFDCRKMERILGVGALTSAEALRVCRSDRLFKATGWSSRLS